jgi:hypothetical protein
MVFKKKRILSLATVAGLLVVTNTLASTVPGFYVGWQLGWGTNQQPGIPRTVFNNLEFTPLGGSESLTPDYVSVFGDTYSDSYKNNGVAGRLFGGYQFNRYFATEVGYTKFSTSTVSAQALGLDGVVEEQIDSLYTNNSIKTYAVDWIIKGILPLKNGLSITGTLGAAYLNESATYNGTYILGSQDYVVSYGQIVSRVFPTFGFGFSYDINKYLAVDLTYGHIQKVGVATAAASANGVIYNTNLTLQNTDYAGLGFSYHFNYE